MKYKYELKGAGFFMLREVNDPEYKESENPNLEQLLKALYRGVNYDRYFPILLQRLQEDPPIEVIEGPITLQAPRITPEMFAQLFQALSEKNCLNDIHIIFNFMSMHNDAEKKQVFTIIILHLCSIIARIVNKEPIRFPCNLQLEFENVKNFNYLTGQFVDPQNYHKRLQEIKILLAEIHLIQSNKQIALVKNVLFDLECFSNINQRKSFIDIIINYLRPIMPSNPESKNILANCFTMYDQAKLVDSGLGLATQGFFYNAAELKQEPTLEQYLGVLTTTLQAQFPEIEKVLASNRMGMPYSERGKLFLYTRTHETAKVINAILKKDKITSKVEADPLFYPHLTIKAENIVKFMERYGKMSPQLIFKATELQPKPTSERVMKFLGIGR